MAEYTSKSHEANTSDFRRKIQLRTVAERKQVLLQELKVCSSSRNLRRGKDVHAEAVESGNAFCIDVATALVIMYAKCGSMAGARQVFKSIKDPNVVLWNVLILGYAKNGEALAALDLFTRMKFQGYAPDRFTFGAALKACTSLALEKDGNGKTECLKVGRQIHSEMGCVSNIHVSNTLIDMYANCGSMVEARQAFDNIKRPNVVCWTALILGYAENGECVTALEMYSRMKSRGCTPDWVAFVAALKASSLLGALESGRRIHAEIKHETEDNPVLVTSLVDFYAKCGGLMEAQKVFDAHPRARDMTTWTALLAGYSHSGNDEAAFEVLKGMLDAGFQPNSVTFLCILTCCSHAGLVEKAKEVFERMPAKYRITPAAEHYNCMIDLLGRSHKLGDALAMVRSMPCRPNPRTWMTLLGACHKWKKVQLGRLAFKSVVSLDDNSTPAYVLMAHIYGTKGMWKEQAMVLEMRKQQQQA